MSIDENRYLFFAIQTENYCIPIEKVREIIRYEKVTIIRDAADFLKGVINLRGSIIPIIDMKVKFGSEFVDYHDRTVFIIVEIGNEGSKQTIGMAVDNVYEVVGVQESEIQPPPKIGLNKKGEYLQGIIKINDSMAMLLNIDSILSSDEIVALKDFNQK